MREETIGGQRLICGNALEVLPTLAAGSVDVTLTDPPYNIGCNYDTYSDAKTVEEYDAWIQSWWDVLPTDRRIVFPGVGNMRLWYKRDPTATACWYKPGATGRANPFQWNEWEPVLVWGCGFSCSDVFKATVGKQRDVGNHPCPKPLALFTLIMERMRKKCSVLDPFLGSGTTLVAAELLGRRGIGIELSPEYFDIACRRVEKAVRDREYAERGLLPPPTATPDTDAQARLFPE